MKAKTIRLCAAALAAAALAGCGANYRWRPSAPADMRTVAVPTFRNESDLQEIGAVASRQILREFQREGTFKIRPTDDAALEVQGAVVSVYAGEAAYDRRSGLRISGYAATGVFKVTVVDRRRSAILIDNRTYRAEATYAGGQDATTSLRNAAGRLCEDLARQVVDDVLNLKWEKEKKK